MKKVIYFDEVCKLCHWSVRLVIRHSKKGEFSFSSLQSNSAQKAIKKINGMHLKYESLVYQRNQMVFTKSDAVLQILKDMGRLWKLFYVFKVIPKSIRDRLYEIIARNRYSWFGKKNVCEIP